MSVEPDQHCIDTPTAPIGTRLARHTLSQAMCLDADHQPLPVQIVATIMADRYP